MELKTFISDTLVGIVEGITDAQARLAKGGGNARINLKLQRSGGAQLYGDAKPVDFDIAVTVAAEQAGGVGGGIKIATIFFAEAKGSLKSETESVSRIRFTVDLFQPTTIENKPPPAPITYPKTGF